MPTITTIIFTVFAFASAAGATIATHQTAFLPSADCPVSSVPYTERYNGIRFPNGNKTRLRITNGGAGQSGLVRALARAYIDWSRQFGGVTEDYLIDWIVGDTTDSINYLQTGDADIAITYNAAAEYRAGNLSISTRRVYGFRDHFYIAGPNANPAKVRKDLDSVNDILNKLVTSGNAANTTPPTRFLSRFDKSATNIKESLLYAQIGQIPWAYAYSKWYHQYPVFPIPALTAAALLQEYTLTDRGTYLTLQSQNKTIADMLTVFKQGGDADPNDPLLNPASVLLGAKVCSTNLALAQGFVNWIVDRNLGQIIVRDFVKPGTVGPLYSMAPDCRVEPAKCAGW